MMKRTPTLSTIMIGMLGSISAGWMIYNIYAYGYLREVSPLTELFGMFVMLGLLIALTFHIVALLRLFFLFRTTQKMTVFRVLTLIVGIVSCITFVGEWAALHDIGDCLQTGMSCAPEWQFLYLAFGPHSLFYALLIVFCIRLRREDPSTRPAQAARDETLFDIVHVVGTCCGLLGLGFTILIFFSHVPSKMLYIILIPYCIFILLPYGLVLSYWLGMKRKEIQGEWYDEKQGQDLQKAGIFTLLVSLPLMTLFFGLNYVIPKNPGMLMWFPYYIFLVLVGFSGSALYFNRR
jgi:hypothetical protein